MTDVRVLGPVEVATDRGPADLRPREAAVVAALALGEQPLFAADIVQLIWPDPPASAVGAVRNHVSNLRRSVSPLVTIGGGYRFAPDVAVDARRLESVATCAAAGALDGSAAVQVATLGAVRDSWRGEAFGELVAHPRVVAAREHLDDLRAVIAEELAAAMLDDRQTVAAHAFLELLVREKPRRSRRWSLLALACYRLGMRDAALAASTRANDFRTDTQLVDDEQLTRIFRDDPVLLTVPARPLTRRAVPVIGPPIDTRLRRFGFVGRQRELTRLQTAIDEGTAGGAPPESRVIALEGEPGIGKTMVAYNAATQANGRGLLVLWSWCDATPIGSFPAISRLVEDLVASLGASAVAALAGSDLPGVVAIAPDADWDPEHRATSRAHVAMSSDVGVRLLVAAARERPMVCVVDDVQWAIASTVRALEQLVAFDAPVVLVVVARPGERPAGLRVGPEMTVVIGDLALADVDEYLRRALEFAPPRGLVETVWSRAGGNPLLLKEMVEAIEPTTSLDNVTSLAAGPVLPRSVDDVAMRRMRDLSPSAQDAVRAASVLGASFSPPLLADIVDLDDNALAEATAAGIIAPESRRGRARFCHELVRAAVYDELPDLRRAQLHEAVGNALTGRNVPRWNEIAHHFAAAADLDPRRAARACRRAGHEALASFRYDDAAEHHRREVELLEQAGDVDTPELVDALVDHSHAMLRSGDPGMVDIARRAALLARGQDDPDRFARAVAAWCHTSMATEAGSPDPTLVELLDEGLALVRDRDLKARLAAAGSYLFSVNGGWVRCRSLYERALASGAGDRAMAEILPFASLTLGGPDDLGRRSAAADHLDRIAEHRVDDELRAAALDVRLGVQVQLADPHFRDSLARVVELEGAGSEPGMRWATCVLSAAGRHIDGDLAAAEGLVGEGLGSRAHGVSDSRRFATYAAQLVAVRTDEGRLAELIPMLEELVSDHPDVAAWRAVFVAALAAAGHVDAARREFDRLVPDDFAVLPHDFTWTAAMTALTRGIARTGDAVRARLAYDALGPYAGRMSWTGNCTFGPIDEALGEAALTFGDEARAAAHFRRALEVAERLGAPRMALRARSRLPGRGGDGTLS